MGSGTNSDGTSSPKPSRGTATAISLAPGTLFSRYQIVREVGRGGMGAVYEVMHVDLHKRFALKLLNTANVADVQVRERFMREGRAASRIRHPHVVDVADVGTHEGTPYLVMEFLEGNNLAHAIYYERPLAFARVLDIMLPVLAAVSIAHDEGVIHRDLKPDNIFLSRTRQGLIVPKVLDFGISKLADAPDQLSLTSTGSFLGTPHYISPEQARRASHVDARSDQYSLGVILYECVTGRLPYEAEAIYDLIAMLVVGEFDPPHKHRPDVPPGLEAVILQAMAHKPEGRFPSVRALGRALLPFASEATRAAWAPTFERAVTSVPPPGADATEINPSPLARAGRDTAVDPHAPLPAHTLANTAHEIDAPRAGAVGPRVWLAAGALVIAIGAAIVGVSALRRHPEAASPATVASAVTTPAARAPTVPPPTLLPAITAPAPAPVPVITAPSPVSAPAPEPANATAPRPARRARSTSHGSHPARTARPNRHYVVD